VPDIETTKEEEKATENNTTSLTPNTSADTSGGALFNKK